MANTHMNRRGSQMNSACYRMAPLAAAVIMILLYTSTFCMASISLAMKINNNQPTETLTTSTTNDNSLSSTTTSITTSATTNTVTNLKQLFPGLWSYLPGKNSSNVAIGDTNGFSFALTERTGEKKTYKGLLQIHASPKPQWLVIDVNSKEISYQFRATPTISTLRVDVRQNRFCFTLNFIPKNSTLLAKVSQFASALLAGEQKVYNFASSTTKYDAAINSLCTTANGVSRVDAFLIADEAVVSCAKKPAKQQNNSPNIFITRSLIIKVGLPMGKGKFIQPSKRCLSLDKFDSRLADTLGNRYFAEMLSDSLDNKVALEKGVSRPTFWFESRSDSCTLAYMADSAKCASYLSSSSAKPTKTCIFIHGAGGPYDQAPKYDSYASYWGDVENWTPQCKKRVFAIRNTKTIGWDDVNLQKYYCDLAVKESGINSTVRGIPQLKNVIIFTHSQGGLVMSAALNNKKCALDSTSSWYSISTPFQGSEMVDRLVTYCAAYKNPTNLLSKDYYYGYLATEYGYCDPATGKPYPGYMSLSKNYSKGGIKTTQLYTATTISRSYKPAGRMCGTSPIGILSRYSLILTALAETTDISNPNDGLLENSSCSSISTGTFTSLQTSAFYSGNVNHADTSCRNGNGWFSRSKQPCLYYKDKI